MDDNCCCCAELLTTEEEDDDNDVAFEEVATTTVATVAAVATDDTAKLMADDWVETCMIPALELDAGVYCYGGWAAGSAHGALFYNSVSPINRVGIPTRC